MSSLLIELTKMLSSADGRGFGRVNERHNKLLFAAAPVNIQHLEVRPHSD